MNKLSIVIASVILLSVSYVQADPGPKYMWVLRTTVGKEQKEEIVSSKATELETFGGWECFANKANKIKGLWVRGIACKHISGIVVTTMGAVSCANSSGGVYMALGNSTKGSTSRSMLLSCQPVPKE